MNKFTRVKISIMTVQAREQYALRMEKELRSQGFLDVSISKDVGRHGARWNMESIFRRNLKGVLVLQDDVIIPSYFKQQLEASFINGENMTFFIGMHSKMKDIYERGFSYAKLWWIWGQANYFTSTFIRTYLGHKWRKDHGRHDDYAINEVINVYNLAFYLTLPMLVDHRELKSAMGNPVRPFGKRRVSNVFGSELLREWDKTKIYEYTTSRKRY